MPIQVELYIISGRGRGPFLISCYQVWARFLFLIRFGIIGIIACICIIVRILCVIIISIMTKSLNLGYSDNTLES